MLPEHNFEKFESELDRMELPTLSARERERVWQGVKERLAPHAAVPSPYLFGFIHLNRTTMIPLALALVVLLGASGTVAASDNARPGDLLFPIDRMSEEARIALTANAEAKAELRARFAEERLKEFEEIVAEETQGENTEAHGTTTASTTLSAKGEARVENALSVLNGFLADAHIRASSTAHARAVLSDLDARFDAAVKELPAEMRARFKASVDAQDTATTTEDRIEAEADVFDNHTNVKVNVDNHPTNFSTSARTRTELVNEISERLNLDRNEVDASLKVNSKTKVDSSDDEQKSQSNVHLNVGNRVDSLTDVKVDARGALDL